MEQAVRDAGSPRENPESTRPQKAPTRRDAVNLSVLASGIDPGTTRWPVTSLHSNSFDGTEPIR
jgi:hypothetical protein